MKRLAICLFVVFAMGEFDSGAAFAAKTAAEGNAGNSDQQNATPADADASGTTSPPLDTTGELDLSDKSGDAPVAAVKTSATLSWQDIAVLPRKRFLKGGRF